MVDEAHDVSEEGETGEFGSGLLGGDDLLGVLGGGDAFGVEVLVFGGVVECDVPLGGGEDGEQLEALDFLLQGVLGVFELFLL